MSDAPQKKQRRRPTVSTAKIDQLKPDDNNARLHTDRNVEMIGNSIEESGTGRSVLIDEDGKLIAGNATVRAAIAKGVREVIIVDADGDKIVAVRRRGLSDEQKERLAIADNRSAELAEWDADVVTALPPGVTEGFWEPDELEMLAPPDLVQIGDDALKLGSDSSKSGVPYLKIMVEVPDVQIIERAIAATGERNRGIAILEICRAYMAGQVSAGE